MLANIMAVLDKTIGELKRFSSLFSAAIQMLYIGYLIGASFIPIGNPVVNGILAATTLAHFLFVQLYRFRNKRKERLYRRNVKHAVTYAKLTVKAVFLGIVVYTTAISLASNNPAVWIMPVIALVLWLISLFLDLAVRYAEKRMALLMDAVKMDLAFVYKTNNVIKWINREVPDDDGSISEESKEALRQMKEDYVLKRDESRKMAKLRRRMRYTDVVNAKKAAKAAAKQSQNEEQVKTT